MFCRNCGTELSEGTKFCTKCGAAVQEQDLHTQAPSQPGVSTEMYSTPAPAPANKFVQSNASAGKSVLFGVIGAAVVLGLAVLSIVTGIIEPETLLGCLILTAIAILIFVIYSMQKHPVADLKSITFDAYDISFGEAVSNSMKNVSWKSEKVDKTRYRVTVQGFCPEEYSYIGVSVDLTYADDHVYASVDSVTVDDEVYDSYIMIVYVMDMVHGE